MLHKIKILIVSNFILEYEKIKEILNPLNCFSLDYTNKLKFNGANYDFIILDLDSIGEYKVKGVLDEFIKNNYKSKTILISSIEKSTLITSAEKLDNLTILPKSTLKDNLIDSIYELIIQDIEFI